MGDFRTPGICRFYIDAVQFGRHMGNIHENQTFSSDPASGQVPAVAAANMFGNNPTKSWTSEGAVGWLSQHTYQSDDQGFANNFYMTDYCIKFNNRYELLNINYIAFLGHNLGKARCWVEPFISKFGVDGVEATNAQDSNSDLHRINLGSSWNNIDDFWTDHAEEDSEIDVILNDMESSGKLVMTESLDEDGKHVIFQKDFDNKDSYRTFRNRHFLLKTENDYTETHYRFEKLFEGLV